MGYANYIWRMMWKCILRVVIGITAVIAALAILQWNGAGSIQQAIDTVGTASESYLKQMIVMSLNQLPFIGDILDWIQSGFQVFRPSGFEVFRDFAKASFLFLTTHYLARLLRLAMGEMKHIPLNERLLLAAADVIRVGGLCLLTASVSLVAYDWFSGLLYDLWGDTVVTNSILFALLILLYIAAAFLMGGRRGAFLSKLFSMLLDTALMLCILCYLGIILFTLQSPGYTPAVAGSLIAAILLLTLAIPFLLRCKLR